MFYYIKWGNKKSNEDICPSCEEKNMKRLGRHKRLCRNCNKVYINPKKVKRRD
tara:strand:+ start:2961 stop:3119 length:159 start_codon:yes stop_codon:yes gene_type:complete